MRYKAVVHLAFGTGGMQARNGKRHQFGSGRGFAFHKSPKRAIELATQMAHRNTGEAGEWCFIGQEIILTKSAQVILHTFS